MAIKCKCTKQYNGRAYVCAYHRGTRLNPTRVFFVLFVTAVVYNRAFFKKNLNASKPSEHPPQVEECLKV